MLIELSSVQTQILENIVDWYKQKNTPFITLGGFAGTGKTTLIAHLSNQLHKQYPKLKIAFGCYTGKAARVLQEKLKYQNAIHPGDFVGTLHSLMYSPLLNLNQQIIGWEKKPNDKFDYQLIIVDEASMLSADIWQDLLSYNLPILAVGDHGQLPPVEGSFNLMSNPQLKLEQIYRQAEGNPIIELSRLAREEGKIPFGNFSREVRKLPRIEPDTQEFLAEKLTGYNEKMLVLVGYNHTRIKINKAIRGLLEFEHPGPMREDRVICLRNDRQLKIYNGMLGYIQSIQLIEDKVLNYYKAEVLFDGELKSFELDLSFEQFNSNKTLTEGRRKGIQLFDFGYALTVHKAQGSQAEKVIVFEERFKQMDDDSWRRWLYTAITRSSKELYIIG